MLPKSKQWWDSPRTRGTKFSIEIKIPFLLRQERGTTPTRSNRSYRDFRFAIDSALPLLQHFPQAKLSSLSKVERWLERDIPPRFFRFSLEKGLGGVGRNLVKSWPRCPSIEGRRRRISRAGVRESSVSLRRVRNNLLNYRMPKVTTLRDERLASGEEYYTRGGWGRGRAGETEWWCVNGIFRGITHARATLYH